MKTLSIVIPFYRRCEEFKAALRWNKEKFAGHQVILALDEPESEKELLRLVQANGLAAKIIVNDKDHAWRSPVKSINVGIRNSDGNHVLVMSPESICVMDVPNILLEHAGFNTYSCGRISSINRKDLDGNRIKSALGMGFLGSICVRRDILISIRGYDESIPCWGFDPANIRARLELYGLQQVKVVKAQLLHIEHGLRQSIPEEFKALRDRYKKPEKIVANDMSWGTDFSRISYHAKADWET